MKKGLSILLTAVVAVSSAAQCVVYTLPVFAAEDAPAEEVEGVVYTPGIYEGTGTGNNGDITVSVTVTENEITGIEILESDETYYQMMVVKDQMPSEIMEKQSLAVDTVAGATMTSSGMLRAIDDALSQACDDTGFLYEREEEEKGEAETLDCDVVVVGAGYSGLTAANRLKQQGVDVLLIEQLDVVGGNGRFSTGAFMLGDTDAHVQLIKDYVGTRYYFDDFPVAEGTPNTDRIMNNIDATQDAYNMYTELGVTFTLGSPEINAYIAAAPASMNEAIAQEGSINTFGSWGAESFKEAYEAQGGRLMLHTKATGLLMDEEQNVVGVTAEGKDCDYVINAKAVVLATGSYSHNDELLEENIPWRTGDYTCTSIGDDGSGILMALEAGGTMTEDNYVNGGARMAYPMDALKTADGGWNSSDAISSVAMIVSLDGERLASEQDDRYFRYYPVEGGQDQFYCIYDSAQLQSVDMQETFDSLASEDGPYYKADTLEELAAKCGMDEAKLQNSVTSFNYYCETGEDVFDASLIDTSTFSQDAHQGANSVVSNASETKLPIEQGPFYATKITFVSFDIVGGVKTGNQGQVLDENGEPISGLYGTGFFSSRDFFGSGTAHGYCLMVAISTGMVTADHIAADLNS